MNQPTRRSKRIIELKEREVKRMKQTPEPFDFIISISNFTLFSRSRKTCYGDIRKFQIFEVLPPRFAVVSASAESHRVGTSVSGRSWKIPYNHDSSGWIYAAVQEPNLVLWKDAPEEFIAIVRQKVMPIVKQIDVWNEIKGFLFES